MVLEFFRQIPNCSGVHRRSYPGYRGSFSPPVSNDTDSRSSLFERTVKRAAPRIWSVREKAAISLFCGVFFVFLFPSPGKTETPTFFAMGMKLTILGSGTSQGVPVIGCRCAVCTSKDPRDNRLRTSAMLEWDDIRLVIDAGPDFRYQMLRTGVRHIDAILLTHEHKDHIGGLDDVRAFNFVDYPTIHRIDVFGTRQTLKCVRKDFDYAFSVDKYRGVPEIELREIDPAVPFCVKDKEVIPVSGHHSPRFEVTGFRFGELAYLTDFKTIAPAEERKLYGVEVLVVNALRPQPHDSHFSLDEALALIRRVAPRRAYLTHMSHEMGLYAERSALLPEGVYLAYDGLEINVND